MSSKPEDFIDPQFWVWYEEEGPKWLLNHRLDIINAMYEAYEDWDEPVVMQPGRPFMFMGSPEEMQEFSDVLKSLIPEAFGLPTSVYQMHQNPPPKKNKTKPITTTDINKLRQSLDTIELKRRKDENSKDIQQDKN